MGAGAIREVLLHLSLLCLSAPLRANLWQKTTATLHEGVSQDENRANVFFDTVFVATARRGVVRN